MKLSVVQEVWQDSFWLLAVFERVSILAFWKFFVR